MALTDNLLHYWKFDGNSSDSLGTANGTDTSVSYVAGKIGNCASFNGTSSKIDTTFVGLTNNFTISVWATKGDPDSLICSCYNSYISFASGGNPRASYYDGVDRSCSSGMAIADSNYHHIVWSKSSTTGQKIYVDGVLMGTEGSTSNMSTGYATQFSIGYFRSFSSNYTAGNIDELGYWSRELSLSEVAQLYNSGTGLSYPFLTPSTSAGFFMVA